MIRSLERNENIGRLPGYYIPVDVRRSRNVFLVCLFSQKNKLWFIYAFKLHGNEIDSKFNLVMLKFILHEKVKSPTDRKLIIELIGIKRVISFYLYSSHQI